MNNDDNDDDDDVRFLKLLQCMIQACALTTQQK